VASTGREEGHTPPQMRAITTDELHTLLNGSSPGVCVCEGVRVWVWE